MLMFNMVLHYDVFVSASMITDSLNTNPNDPLRSGSNAKKDDNASPSAVPLNGNVQNDVFSEQDLDYGHGHLETARRVRSQVSSLKSTNAESDNDIKELFQRMHLITFKLFELKMRGWMATNPRDLNSIGSYLGYPEPTKNVINAAMTQLLGQHRKKKMLLNEFIDMFYYAGDVKNVGDDISTVIKTFKSFLSQSPSNIGDLKEVPENILIERLKRKLMQVPADEKVKSQLSITIPLMKNMMLVEPAKNKALDGLKNIMIFEKTLSNLAKDYSKSVKGTEVNENHLRIMYYIVPDIFRYLFSFLHLLTHLLEHLSDHDEKEINLVFQSFSKIPRRFTSMFLERYFKFKGEKQKRLFDAMDSLIGFFEPNQTQPNSVYHKKPNILHISSYIQPNRLNSYRNYVMIMTEDILDKLMKAFKYNYDVRQWITYGVSFEGVPSKKDFFGMMNANTQKCLNVLNAFSEYFIPEEEL